jgi:diaminohydroxyphosphoribosylaminopyrimidine deaminase/5-amino-6-(5-phosphoribosylamino)uracil reductase
MNHEEFMRRAIDLAKRCEPRDPKRTPRLGVLITRGDAIIAEAYRGTGVPGDDDHAELIACGRVPAPEQIAGSTVYTTLEPCTHHTRRSTSEACTDLLIRNHVAKVVIGILDPNQAVCGRGFNQLQGADIEVEMFPHHLAREVRAGNADFIRAQQTYSPTILYPKMGEVVVLKPSKQVGRSLFATRWLVLASR